MPDANRAEIDAAEREIGRLEREVEERKRQISLQKQKLDGIYRTCHHDWEEKYDPIVHQGYYTLDLYGHYIEGQERRIYVPERKEDRWKRKCRKCGKEEFTSSTRQVTRNLPNWG